MITITAKTQPTSKNAQIGDMLRECGAVKFGNFILASGRTSTFYIDIKRASTNPAILKAVAKEMANRIKHIEDASGKKIDRIVCIELGAVPVTVALAIETGIPFAIIRKQPKGHGTDKKLEGEIVKGERTIIVEDVTTTGGSVIRVIDAVRENGASIDTVLVVVDRGEGAGELLAEKEVKLVPLVGADQLLNRSSQTC